jgi:hypothetical protein
MAVQTGRTVDAFSKLLLGAAGGSMTDMKIDSRGELGIDYEENEMSSWSDAGKGVIMGQADFSFDFGGPIDNTASTGPSTLLRQWHAAHTLLSFDYQIGVGHPWESGEQQFGLTGVVASGTGVIVTKYKESGGKYAATIRLKAGSATLPAWGTAAEAIPS